MAIQTPNQELLAAYLQIPIAAPLLDINFGFARARVLDTAIELRLFTHIAAGAQTCSALANAADCNVQALQILLEALLGLELLQRKRDTYSLTALAATYLVEGQPGYIGTHLRAVIEQWDTWGNLTQIIRTGDRQIKRDWSSPEGRASDPGMFTHLFPLVFPAAWQAASQVEPALQGRVLDISAGSGAWSIATALRHPQVEVIARDEPALLEDVYKQVTRFGLEERVLLQSTQVELRALPSESFSLVIVGHVCRFKGARKSQALLRECYRLLQPGGKLILADVMPNDERTGPSAALMIGLSLFLNSQEGGVFTGTQYHTWLRATGFEQIKELRLGPLPLLLASR
ncbi:class I SAM-dependent methyltransferase [Ktedonospora formicarum]|uniref:Methyltransferase domain-containing protein n=1 Tax=Ktedonospora formicarum TaxID=2778364 RepID=A0A8J3I626_9CHLR|nr:class I SAM-dependent methyltransferase [Ktedonospora formicarum]GHO50249.1 hypothetical protein KSX_84120 [Ktedonospora formicarum]